MDHENWSKRTQRFQHVINSISEKEERLNFLSRYAIRFDYQTFKTSDFHGLTFPVKTSFRSASFAGKEVNFCHVKFLESVHFNQLTFHNNVMFLNTQFQGEIVTFDSSIFRETAHFGLSQFKAHASFSRAKFLKGASFVNIDGSQLKMKFYKAEFEDDFILTSVERNSNSVHIFECLDFSEARFESLFKLRAKLCDVVKFYGANFKLNSEFIVDQLITVPDFRETKFDRPPNLSRLFIKETPRIDRFLPNHDQEIVDKWRVLKRLAVDAGDHEKAGQFFANEMAAKRGTEITGFWPLFFSGIYYAFSNFGQSYFRPSAWLALFGTFFATLYYVLLPNALAGWDRILFSAEYSVRNLIPFLGSLFRFSARPVTQGFATGFEKNLSLINEAHGGIDLFIYLGVVEQLIGGILFFLLLLGLRNVFRMK
ncbi:hypothetical protein [Maritalea myrionectae]|uniref:hypothetical protein n=1 Tax=Maritalea myrionectae TaxID=454601 RepID=UPI0013C366EE|nr:hypothetical protein [Maritalea myrionectae]